MIRTFILRLLLTGSAVAVAACCGSKSCVCDDSTADAVTFLFNLDTAAGGFAPEQVDSVYLRRIPTDTTQLLKPDSVLLVRTAAQAAQPIVLNNTLPLAANGTRKINQYRYVLRLASRVKPPAAVPRSFIIDQVYLEGKFAGDGCCTCYVNTKKTVTFDKRIYDQTIAGQNPVVLSR